MVAPLIVASGGSIPRQAKSVVRIFNSLVGSGSFCVNNDNSRQGNQL